jgi:hypothetical protein
VAAILDYGYVSVQIFLPYFRATFYLGGIFFFFWINFLLGYIHYAGGDL